MQLFLKLNLVLLFSALLLTSQLTQAALVEVPAFSARVVDLTQTLTASEQANLEGKLEAFEATKGSQIAVLIVPTTQPEAIEQYAIRVVGEWKVGRKDIDDGLLILIAKNDRKMRIEVGYGLEGAIPDVYAKRIITETMTPYFKRGDFAGGIDAAVAQLIGLIEGEPLPAPKKANLSNSQLESLLPLLLFGGMISGMILRGIFGTFMGSALNGGFIGTIVFFVGLSLFGAGVLGLIAFIFTLMMGGGRGVNGYGGYPTRGGGYSGGYSGGGFSGGLGGGFGGGGASGSW
ncbi:MAG: TPM domain-containing protein [Methylotenera sp.]